MLRDPSTGCDAASQTATRKQPPALDMDQESAARKWITVRTEDVLYQYAFPVPDALSGSMRVRWPLGAAIGPLTELTPRSLPHVLTDERPKVYLVLSGRSTQWEGLLPSWLPRLQAGHSNAFKFVLFDPIETEVNGFLSAFGLSTSDAPTAVIDDSERQQRRTLGGAPLSEEALTRLLREYVDEVRSR